MDFHILNDGRFRICDQMVQFVPNRMQTHNGVLTELRPKIETL